MVTMNGYTVTPHHRQNRRRERPGAKTRRTVTRKSKMQTEFTEGLMDAYDSSVYLPSDKARPSPLLRENFHQTWQRWKAREAEEKALEAEKFKLEQQEQQRLYGGDGISDDELKAMGILYDSKDEENTIACEVPSEQASPMFILRHRKPKPRRRSTWRSLPLYLSFSSLGDDADIARLLSPSISNPPTPMTIQHHELSPPPNTTDIPQSLPPIPALESALVHGSQHLIPDTPSEMPQTHSLPLNTTGEDWEFINTPQHHSDPHTATPLSEPETWILLGDDS